jgi:uncharacterized membrane protein YccC
MRDMLKRIAKIIGGAFVGSWMVWAFLYFLLPDTRIEDGMFYMWIGFAAAGIATWWVTRKTRTTNC